MKIWAPICSATTGPFRAIEPLSGAGTPALSRRKAVCSVESPIPPPEDGPLRDDVVEPGLTDLARTEVAAVGVVRQRAQERERAGDVIIGDDQRLSEALMDVAGHLAQLSHDALIRPAFERPPHIDANEFAEHARIDTFEIVRREGHRGAFRC